MADEPADDVPTAVRAAKWTAKHDATTKAAMEIIERERVERNARTARLREARLARDAELTDVSSS